ncbi:MAG: nuclear transport factor 2 family protein [Gammaproteobacteria bacterium]|nr:nuclear transport factor 2 family protein [Gammaproteobacteria bacterium]
MNKIDNKEIEEVEENLRQAMMASDISMLDKLISPCLIFTNHLGHVMSKDDDLNGHKSGDFLIEDIVLSDSTCFIHGDTAVVATRADITGSYKGSPANGNFRFTRVWQKHDNQLQVIAGHSCIIA